MKKIILFTLLFTVLGVFSSGNAHANGPEERKGCVVDITNETILIDGGDGQIYTGKAAQVNLLVGDNVIFVAITTPSGRYIAIKVIKDEEL